MERLCTVGFIIVVAMGLVGMAGMALSGSKLEIAAQWVNVTPKASDGHHGYFTLTNRSPVTRRLVGVESPFYAKTVVQSGVTGRPPPILLTPGARLEFQPSGPFAQLSRPSRPTPSGASVPIVLLFDNGERVSFSAPLKKIVTKANASGARIEQHAGRRGL
jgi:copper(I)-binding protein